MIRNLLVLADGTELAAGTPGRNALRSLQWTHTLNAGTDLTPGSACADSLEAEIWVQPGSSPGIAAGDVLTLYRLGAEGGRTLAGTFTAEKPTRQSRDLYRVTAYDFMARTERDLSPWLREHQGDFPLTLDALVQAVAAACGLTLANSLPRNGSYQVAAFYADGLTGRQLLQWAAQAAGCFVHCDAAGALAFGWYADCRGDHSLYPGGAADPALGAAAPYRQDGLSYEDYAAAPIDKVQIRQSGSDVGVIYPPDAGGDNALVVEGNLLLTTQTASALEPVARALYQAARSWPAYTPCTVRAFGDCPAAAGELLYLDAPDGRRLTTCLMTAVYTAEGVRLESTGNPRRDCVDAVNERKYANLQGRMLELQASVDGLTVKAADLAGDYTELNQTVEGLQLHVVTDGQIRTAFAADDASVTIRSGSIAFTSNTLVVDSDNFQLDAGGNVSITGDFYSRDGSGNDLSIYDGLAYFTARRANGTSYNTVVISRSVSGSPCGILDVWGIAADGTANPQVRLRGGLTDGSISLYNAYGTEQGYLTAGEGNVSWLAGGLDVRGEHGVQSKYGSIGNLRIDALGVGTGAVQTVYWKWDGTLGAYVLSTSP